MIIKKSEQCSTFQINVIFSLNMTRTGVFNHSEIRNGHAASRKIIRFGGVKMSKSNFPIHLLKLESKQNIFNSRMMKMMMVVAIDIQATIKMMKMIETLLQTTLKMWKPKVLLFKIDLPKDH